MRQLIGWYNVVDFNGDCKGQIKLGVSPVTPLSPSRCSPASRTGYHPFQKEEVQGTSCVISSVIIPDEAQNMVHQNHLMERFSSDGVPLIHLQSNQKDNQRDLVFGSQMSFHSEIKDAQTNPVTDELPICSTSVLFSQLRQNMRELDTLQHDLNLKLRSQSVTADAICTQELLGAEPSRTSFKNAWEVSDNTLKTAKSIAETRLESKPLEGELMSSEPAGPNDNGQVDSLSLDKLGWRNSANHATEKNLDVMLPPGADSSHPRNVLPDQLLIEEEGDHFFTLEKTSQIEGRRQSVDSEISGLNDTSEDCSVSGYIQDNTKKSKFSDIKDSWLSSEEEDTFVSMDEVAISPSSSSAQDRERRDISSLNNSTKSNDDEQKEEISAEDDDGNFVHSEMENTAEKFKVAETFQERSTEHKETAQNFAKNTPDLLKKNHDFDREQENQYKELPRQTVLPNHQITSITVPDFFIPSDQMEESMRALQWGLRNNSRAFHSKLLARSNNSDKQTKCKLSERFTKKESLNKARNGERPPISYSESERIARIFKSGTR